MQPRRFRPLARWRHDINSPCQSVRTGSNDVFHIRHQDVKQKRDYDEFYLDWIFWLYLSTIELTNRVIDEQTR